ncbi:MAG: GNAT family N-acetyltransferase [Clostridiaceae bacterium]|nr:GNAT family N-acetyltransferase [Clostridiaceae bacterium]
MRIEIINNIEKLMSYKEEWDKILEKMNSINMFLELDWITYWWKFFGYKHELLVLVIADNNKVAGFCPLMITKKRVHNEVGFIGSRESGRMDFLLREELREEALECIFNFLRNLKGKNIVKLNGVPEKSENYGLIKKYIKKHKVPFAHSSIVCYFLNLNGIDFKNYFEYRFGKKTRQTMSSKEKKLSRLGKIGYKRINTSELDEVFEIHDKRWLRKIGNSSFSKGETREFFKELLSYNCEKFNVSVDAITINNRVISFMYGFEYKGKYLFYRIAHDDDYAFLSPGELVFKKKMEECFSSKINVFDFGTGYEPYKAKWSDYCEEIFNIVIPSKNLQSSLIFYLQYWSNIKLKGILKRNKAIYNFRKYSLGKIKLLFSRAYISEQIGRLKRNMDRIGIMPCIFCFKKYLLSEIKIVNKDVSQNSLQVKEASIDDLDALSEVMEESSSNIIRRFVNKHKCFITTSNSEIIHYCWINCGRIKISGVDLNLPLGNLDVCIYDTFLKRNYVTENNCRYILSCILNLLYRENYKRCYVAIDCRDNSPESEIYKEKSRPAYKVIEKVLFGRIKHNAIKLS